MPTRNTFTAISFNAHGSRIERVSEMSVVPVANGRVIVPSSYVFRPLVGCRKGDIVQTFDDVFSRVRKDLTDIHVPVIGWGGVNREILAKLIDAHDIDIERPIRYFDIQGEARLKMGESTSKKWQAVAAKLNVEVVGRRHPTALDCAKLHLALEKIDYSLIVARAFVTFIKSIMYDPYTPNAISLTEAQGLQAFLSVLTNDFKQFKSLKDLVDKALEDEKIENFESDDLMAELKKMESQYQGIIDSGK